MLSDHVKNPLLTRLEADVLYHLGLHSRHDLKGMFQDVRWVCMGGSPLRAEDFAAKVARQLGLPTEVTPVGKTERYSLYKVGPVLSASHGIGMPSLLVVLHEITKLLHYAGCREVTYIRVGTCGGLGLEPGTVVVSRAVLNARLQPFFEQVELGEVRRYPLTVNETLARAVYDCRGAAPAVLGTTVGTDDFYEGQARLDGALKPAYDEAARHAYFERLHALGVRNLEMESPAFVAFTGRAGIPAAVVCATVVDRLRGDQLTSTAEELAAFSDRAQRVVLDYLAPA